MKFDADAMIEDVAIARVTLYKQHCEAIPLEYRAEAATALGSQLMYQAFLCFAAAFVDDKQKAQELMLQLLEDEPYKS